MDNRQAYHQASIIDMEGNLHDQRVSILIDHGSNYMYINPDLVDKCCLNKEVHAQPWLVLLDIGTNRNVHKWARYCAFDLNGHTSSHLMCFLWFHIVCFWAWIGCSFT